MQNLDDKKSIFGMVLFALSILMLIYMLISPLNQLVVNVEEYFTLTLVNFPIADIISMSGSDVNPPLYYLLVKALSKVADDLFIMKIFSVIPYAVILIASAVKIRKDYGWLTCGLFAFALGVTSEFFTYFSILRPQAWAVLFVVMAFIFMNDILKNDDNISWILFTVFCVLSAYTYYFAGITAVCLYIILLAYIVKLNMDGLKKWGISLLAFVILYFPWILPLAKLLGSIHESFWVPAPTFDVVIQALAYFAYSADTFLSVLMILIVALICIFYIRFTKHEDEMTVYAGFGAFILTLVAGLVISFAFKPVLLARCLLPAAALVWLSISIIISRLEDKLFVVSFALIVLVLLSGVGFMISETNELAQSGVNQKEVLDNITSDNESVVILTTPNMIVHFLDYSGNCDMYCIDTDYIYSENMDRVHEFFNFKDITADEISNFTSDKNVYLISWGEPDVDLNTTELSSENGVVISEVNFPEAEEEYYY